MTSILRSFAGAIALSSFSGCSTTHQEAADNSESWEYQQSFAVSASDWSSHGTNPFFVLEPGYRMVFEGLDGKKKMQLVITVLDDTRTVDGVETRVVEERETANGQPTEVSRNYFAISRRTNDLYYFGEEVDIYKHGQVSAHEGAWLSGVAGAKFGLMMPGTVQVGRKFHQEVAPGVAMDRCEITSSEEKIDTPAGRFEHCLKVRETSPVEPGHEEFKLYARGVGLVQDEDLLLVSYGKGSTAR
jgi:hypothetical protein